MKTNNLPKLCCLINPVRTCYGCNTRWCEACRSIYDWTPEGISDHRSINPAWESGWHCPIAKTVYADVGFSETFNLVTNYEEA